MARFLKLKSVVIFGGVSQSRQVSDLRRGCDFIVATPGRLMDLMNQNYIVLNGIEYFVLDEADRMLDMGFVHEVKRIITPSSQEKTDIVFLGHHATRYSVTCEGDTHQSGSISPLHLNQRLRNWWIRNYIMCRKTKNALCLHHLLKTNPA